MKKKEKKERRWLARGANTGMLILLIAALAAVNIAVTRMETKFGWKADYSFNSITTQSDTTLEVLAEMEHPVQIYALFTKGQEDAPLMELLDRYAAASDKVTWEQVDPNLNPAILTRFNTDTESVNSDSLIVYCEETDRWKILSPAEFVSVSLDTETGSYTYAGYTYEKAITSAIANVTKDEIPRVVIIQGHGELDGETLGTFDSLLENNHYEVVYAKLSNNNYTPDPADLIVLFSPMKDITEDELEKLTIFTDQGGSLLITCDYSDPIEDMPNWSALLRSYGFVPLEGIVVADAADTNSYYNQIRIDLIPEMLSTDVTMDLISSGADTMLLPGSRAFETPEDTDRNLMVFPVLQSGETSYLKKVDANITTLEKEDGDATGPFTLAMQARRITTGGYVSRAFIIGSSGALTESQIYAMTDTQQLIIRMVEWLSGQESSNLDIMAKDAIRSALSAKSNTMGSVMVSALPLAVLAAAIIVLMRRRNA